MPMVWLAGMWWVFLLAFSFFLKRGMSMRVELTKKQLEAEMCNLIRAFHKEKVGRGPTRILCRLVNNMAIVWMEGGLTRIEMLFSEQERGRTVVREFRSALMKEWYSSELNERIEGLFGLSVMEIFTDVNVENDSSAIVFVFRRMVA
jgi:uncharacterized protein YbcI